MDEDWLKRWEEGRTGWHEPGGNAGLKSLWPGLAEGTRVLVPLCGKSPDLLWLARQGLEVVGVELSPVAVQAFFADNGLPFRTEPDAACVRYRATDVPVTICQGDYFEFSETGFGALYDRGALVALPERLRPDYANHTRARLRPGAVKLIVTLEYDQAAVTGPPFSVMPDEMRNYWPDVERIAERDDLDTCPPKFRQAGLREIREVFWRS